MLFHLRRRAHQLTRLLPHSIRTLTTLDPLSATSSQIQDHSIAALHPALPEHSATPPPSLQAFNAYAFPSAAQETPPILDIPPESDPLLAYLTSHLMRHGKRHAAARRTSRMLLHLHALTRSPPLPLFRDAVFLAAPSVRIVSHKKGGKNVQKPMPLGEKQRTRFAIKWMLDASDKRRGRTIEERLAREVLEIIKGTPQNNEVLKKKEDLHRLGMVNRGNARAVPQRTRK